MFRPNETHRQQDIFGIETQLSPELWKRLRESEEYAFYEEVFCRIPEEVFAELYSDSSATRPNTPVNVLVGALILQHAHAWTFAELMDRVCFDLKVRSALGLWSLAQLPFSRATLFNFLARVHDDMVATGRNRFEVAFDGLTDEQRERFGLNSSIQRCDSTQIGSNIRDYTRIELLVEVVLRMWRVLGEARQEEHKERFAPYVDAKTAGKFLYRLSRSDIGQTLEQLGQLYGWMVDALKDDYGTTEIHHIVCRVFAEQFTRVEEKITIRAATQIGSDSLQSPDDPEATYRVKDGEEFHGFVLHVAETANPENDLQLIVESMTRAGQGALFEQFLQRKARLEAEGLFDAARKRALPTMPRSVGLVTSLGAAALVSPNMPGFIFGLNSGSFHSFSLRTTDSATVARSRISHSGLIAPLSPCGPLQFSSALPTP